MKKKIFLVFLAVLAAVVIGGGAETATAAKESDYADGGAKELEDYVDEQLGDLDSSEIDKLLDGMTEDQLKLFGGMSFKEKVKSLLNGDFSIGYDSLFSALFHLFFDGIYSLLPTFSVVAAIAILCGMLNGTKTDFISEGTSNIIFFVCYSAVLMIILTSVFSLITSVTQNINALANQMNAAFPIILTLMAAGGGTSSVAVYTPAVAFLSNGVVQVILYMILPIINLIIVFSVVGNLSGSIKLNKFNEFFKSAAKWIMGISITVFTLFLTVQGITAAAYDGVSFRIAKYTVGNTIPIVGGFLKDGMDLIIASSILIKNAVGSFGILLIISTILAPFLAVVAFSLFLKLTAAIIQPVTDSRICEFFSNISAGLNYLIAAVLSVGFMYLLTVVLLICSTNSIL